MATKTRKPGSGGARPGAGREKKEQNKKKPYSIYLTAEQHAQLTKINKNLTKVITTLLPPKAP